MNAKKIPPVRNCVCDICALARASKVTRKPRTAKGLMSPSEISWIANCHSARFREACIRNMELPNPFIFALDSNPLRCESPFRGKDYSGMS